MSPRTQAFLYDRLFKIHFGILNPVLSLLPRTKPFMTRKSTTDVLARDTIKVFLVFLLRIAGIIPKSFLHVLKMYLAYRASLIEFKVIFACHGLLIPPSPIIIPKNSASNGEYLGRMTFLR